MISKLSHIQLIEIESHIDEISESIDLLDPNNPIESQMIDRNIYILSTYIKELEARERFPRLTLVS